MKKLFVDDIRQPPDETWTVARTVTEAISAIATFYFDVISLDHDISHQVVMGGLSRPYPCDETFVPVAQFIAMKHQMLDERVGADREGGVHWRRPKIIIHTANPSGAVRIAGHLDGFAIERQESAPVNRFETES